MADSSPQKKKKEEKEEKEEGKGEKHLCPSANFHLFDRMERDPRSAKNNRQIKPSAKSNPSRPPISHEKRSSSIVVGNQGNKPPPFNDSIFMSARELHRLFGDIYVYIYICIHDEADCASICHKTISFRYNSIHRTCIFWDDVTRRIKDRSLGMGVAGTRRNGGIVVKGEPTSYIIARKGLVRVKRTG